MSQGKDADPTRFLKLALRTYSVAVLTPLRSGLKNLHETYQSRMYSRILLMMGREDARNM